MAILTVCSSGCDYTTIGAAVSAATSVDYIDIQEDIIDETLILNKNIAGIFSSNGSSWNGTGSTDTLRLLSGLTQELEVYDLTMDHSSGVGEVIRFSTYGTNAKLHVYDCILNRTAGNGQDIVIINPDITITDGVFFERCWIEGDASATAGIECSNAATTNSIRIQNCVILNLPSGSGIVNYENTTNSVVRCFNNTIFNCDTGIIMASRGDFRNNIFANNTDDVSLTGSSSDADFTYNSFEEQTSPFGSNNIFGITSTNEFEDEATEDFHLKFDAQSKDAGSDLSGIVDDDYDDLERPLGAGYDIGAFERPVPLTFGFVG